VNTALDGLRRRIAASRLGPLAAALRRIHWSRPDRVNWETSRELVRLLSHVLREDSSCIDVGAHRGSALALFCRFAPKGHHLAFEPLPDFAAGLRTVFPGVEVHALALSDATGETEFQHVVTNPGYSGLRRRRYDRTGERIETIRVRAACLDDVLQPERRVDFLKVDVEGAELQVFRGAVRTLRRWKPYVLFEHGRGAADHYGTSPEMVHRLLVADCGLSIFTLDGRGPLSQTDFAATFAANRVWDFLARPYAAGQRAGGP
jgi:FkbM family methyltransferase